MWWIRGETPIAIIMRYQLMLISDWNLRNGWILGGMENLWTFFGGGRFSQVLGLFWDVNGSMWLILVFVILIWFFNIFQLSKCSMFFFSTQLLRCFISFFLTHWWILIAFFIVDGQNPAWKASSLWVCWKWNETCFMPKSCKNSWKTEPTKSKSCRMCLKPTATVNLGMEVNPQ